MVIVNTDHGFLLGEHDSWAKSCHPWYDETAHLPLFIWDSRYPELAGCRRRALVQNLDIPETILSYFGVPILPDMQGHDLEKTLLDDTPVRQYALFGMFGAQVNITDGRYVYMRSPVDGNAPLYNYTLMPTHMRQMFSVEEMRSATMFTGFSFTKGVPVMRIKSQEDTSGDTAIKFEEGTKLFDLERDPMQRLPIQDVKIEHRMVQAMIALMQENDAPEEQYERLGLKRNE